MQTIRIHSLHFEDDELRSIDLPAGPMRITRGFGSGLTRNADGRIWAVGDRGPNLKVDLARSKFGLAPLGGDYPSGAKLMPCLDVGPALSELVVRQDRVEVVRTLPICDPSGQPISGLPIPGGDHCQTEPAIGLDGAVLPADPGGADTEGLIALADGSFWVGDEYGPSLIRLDANGVIVMRWVPAGSEDELAGAPYPVLGALPAIAARRQLNRGFEAIGISPDQAIIYLAFQSPLAHPDEAAHKAGRWVRLWTLDAATGTLLTQFIYPLDPPHTFRRDGTKGEVAWADLKVSELTVLAADRLLMLERGSESTKLYAVTLDPAKALPPEHGELSTRPTLEELSTGPARLPLLDKQLVLDTDDWSELGADLEGMVLLEPSSLLIVNDNDFGVEGARTRFWRVDFPEPL